MRQLLIAGMLLPWLAASVQAAGTCTVEPLDRLKIGLVLGGGGARGSAHIGVIRMLEELQVPVDYVVGTSMGALVGGFYATGMSADDLESLVADIDWERLFADSTPREELPFRRKQDDTYALYGPRLGLGAGSSMITSGALAGQNIDLLFETLVNERAIARDFNQLAIPYRAVAADLLTGDAVVLESGNLATAMRASMSVPGVFEPASLDGALLVDGGIVANLPVDVARQMGADIVIAVDVGAKLLKADEIRHVLDVVEQLTDLMVKRNVDEQLASLGPDDVLIQPRMGNAVGSTDFDAYPLAIEAGYAASKEQQSRLAELALDSAAYRARRLSIENCLSPATTIDFVRLENSSRLSDSVIRTLLTVEPGQPLNRRRIERDIQQIYGLGFLSNVRYELVSDAGQTGIVVHVADDPRGTQYLEWGLDVFADNLDDGINVRLGYLNTHLDDRGSEFRAVTQVGQDAELLVEIYKYIGDERNYFVQPSIGLTDRDVTVFDDEGNATSRVGFRQYGASVGVGREIGRFAALSAGVRHFEGRARTTLGPPDTLDRRYRGGEYYVDFTYDRLDDLYFPSKGNLLSVDYSNSSAALGSEDAYERLSVTATSASTWGRHTVLGGMLYGHSSGDLALSSLFLGGGFLRLSGFHEAEIAGPNIGILSGSYQYRVAGTGLLPARLGFSLEYGGVANDRDDLFDAGDWHGSVFAGYRSPIGPAYLGAGFGEGGQARIFLRIGRVFGRQSLTGY